MHDSGIVTVGTALLSASLYIPPGTKDPVGCSLPTDTSGKPKKMLRRLRFYPLCLNMLQQVAHCSCRVQNLPEPTAAIDVAFSHCIR